MSDIGNAAGKQNRAFDFGQNQAGDDSGKTLGKTGGKFKFDVPQTSDSDVAYRSARSQAYMDIVALIDLTSASDKEIMEKLREVVDEDTLEEFSEMTPEEIIEELRLTFQEEMKTREVLIQGLPEPDTLYGIISKCYIDGCDIHAIDQQGYILEHFRKNQNLPDRLAIGRELYRKCGGKCNCIEIYNCCARIINTDGSVTRVDYDSED